MRIVVDVRIEDANQPNPASGEIGVIERSDDGALSSGLGLLLQETKDLLRELQAVMREQVARLVAAASKATYRLETLPQGMPHCPTTGAVTDIGEACPHCAE